MHLCKALGSTLRQDKTKPKCFIALEGASVSPASSRLDNIPRGIWVLGLVCLVPDVSSQLIHSHLALFLFTGFGTTKLSVELIGAIARSLLAVRSILL